MALTWTEAAIVDLEHIRRYVTAVDRAAAARLAHRIIALADALDAAAALEPPERIADAPLAHPFLLRYRGGAAPVVLGVRHDARGMIV